MQLFRHAPCRVSATATGACARGYVLNTHSGGRGRGQEGVSEQHWGDAQPLSMLFVSQKKKKKKGGGGGNGRWGGGV